MKKCPRCGEEKQPDEFHKNSRVKSGLSVYCKKCKNAMDRKATPLVVGIRKPMGVLRKDLARQALIVKYGIETVEMMGPTNLSEDDWREV